MKTVITIMAFAASIFILAACKYEGPVWPAKFYSTARGEVYMTCIEGHMFAIFEGSKGGGITQVWDDGPNGARPMQCTPEVRK